LDSKNTHKMAQDIISDALNQIMNAKKAEKIELSLKRYSKFLIEVLNKMKERGHIDFKIEDKKLVIKILRINECKAIKPRFNVGKDQIERYARRFLPSRNFGLILVSTSQGLINHFEAQDKKLGGSLIAYFY